MSKGEIVRVDTTSPEPDLIDRAAAVIANDGIVVAPTETRYGLLTRADRPENVKKLYRLKERDLNMPTAVFLKDKGMLRQQTNLSASAEALADRFLPGPLTLVVKALEPGEPPVTIDGRLGVRISSAPIIAALTERASYPITATSANKSGQPDPSALAEVVAAFGNQVDLYLDGGELDGPLSTVVDATGEAIVMLREGALSASEIEDAIRGVN